MLAQKLIAAVELAGALLLGVSGDAAANPLRGHCAPVYRAPVVVAPPVYRAVRAHQTTSCPRNPPPADVSSPRRELLRPGCFPLPWQ